MLAVAESEIFHWGGKDGFVIILGVLYMSHYMVSQCLKQNSAFLGKTKVLQFLNIVIVLGCDGSRNVHD